MQGCTRGIEHQWSWYSKNSHFIGLTTSPQGTNLEFFTEEAHLQIPLQEMGLSPILRDPLYWLLQLILGYCATPAACAIAISV